MKTYKEILEDIQKESTAAERKAARKQYAKAMKKMTSSDKKKRAKKAAKLAKKRVGKAVRKQHLGFKRGESVEAPGNKELQEFVEEFVNNQLSEADYSIKKDEYDAIVAASQKELVKKFPDFKDGINLVVPILARLAGIFFIDKGAVSESLDEKVDYSAIKKLIPNRIEFNKLGDFAKKAFLKKYPDREDEIDFIVDFLLKRLKAAAKQIR